jgi:hypothetical protein
MTAAEVNQSSRTAVGNPDMTAWYIDPPQSSLPLVSGAPKSGRTFYTSLGHSDESELHSPLLIFDDRCVELKPLHSRLRFQLTEAAWQDATFQQHVQLGLQWALDGQSTRAYGEGLVGNQNASSSAAPSTSASAATGSASGSSTSASATSNTAASGSAQTSTGAALQRASGGGVVTGAVVGGAVAVALGAAAL